MKNIVTGVLLLSVSCLPAFVRPVHAGGPIGVIRTASGAATVTRGENAVPAARGFQLAAGDILRTGPDGAIGISLRDDSSLSIGPDSRLVLRDFLFAPSEGAYSLVVRITRGTMAYISGLIGKLAPEKARVETPTATIGIRGTRFAVKVEEPSE